MRLGGRRIAQLDRFARYVQTARVGVIETGHDLDQGGLARAVLAHQGVDLSRPQVE